jgi:two-component system, chemotaxis family, response regulator Rcp1
MASNTGSNGNSKKPLGILLIENDPAFATLTREGLKEVGLHESITSVPDWDKALAYLKDKGNYSGDNIPDIIFLDLHLPKISGLEVLREIKENRAWSVTPVVVVSGSADPHQVRRAYELHASCYIRKPSDLDEFLRFIRVCYEFWGTVVTLPEKG